MPTSSSAPLPLDGIATRVPLAPRCTLGVGGPAAYFVEATHRDAILRALDFADARGLATHILGGGSNILIADGGVPGLVLAIALRGIQRREIGDRVELTAQAGEPWDAFVEGVTREGLSGVECLSGIPGLVGATPVQNVGAYGQEVSDTIVAVEVIDRTTRAARVLSAEELGFGYRDSMLKSGAPDRFIVTAVTYRLERNGRARIRYPELERHLAGCGAEHADPSVVRGAVLALRRSKSMVVDDGDPNRRSCGSFFVNPVVTEQRAREIARAAGADGMPRFAQPDGSVKLSAGWLIERAGFPKGVRFGDVGLSTRHALCVVCHDGGTARDVLELARRLRDTVESRFGVRLVPEPAFWGFGEPF